MAQGSDLRVLLGALAGVGLGGVLLLTVLPKVVPLDGPRATPVAAEPEAPPQPTVAAASPAPAEAVVPRFDTVRVAPDGSGVVAGQAEAGATVAVLADDEVAAEVTADADGRFVAFLDLPPSAEPRGLSLRDGRGGISDETVIVAPTGGLAEADGKTEVASVAPMEEGPVPDDAAAEIQGAVEEPARPLTRDLPSDRPTPDLAPSDEATLALASPEAQRGSGLVPGNPVVPGAASTPAEVVAAPPETDTPGVGFGVEEPGEAASDAVRRVEEGPAADAETAGQPVVLAPGVASGGPSGAAAPAAEDEGPGTGAPLDALPSSVAVAVPGPSALPPDVLPEHGPAPDVAGVPTALPAPESGVPGQAAVLVSDAEGVRVLQPALPPGADAETLSTVALDAIAYGGEGEVVLSGRASGGGTVRLYLDNAPLADVPVDAQGQWSATLPGSTPGTFTLRVDQIDSSGAVVSRMETPFQREGRDELASLMARAQRPGQTIAMRTVQPGNTLWAIARERYGEPLMYVRVFEMNRDRIRDPDLIYPGQVFVLPATTGR